MIGNDFLSVHSAILSWQMLTLHAATDTKRGSMPFTGADQQQNAPTGTAQALTSNGIAAPQAHQHTNAAVINLPPPASVIAPGAAPGHNDQAIAPDPTAPAAAAAQPQFCAGTNEVALQPEPAPPNITSMAPMVAEQTKRLSEVRLFPT